MMFGHENISKRTRVSNVDESQLWRKENVKSPRLSGGELFFNDPVSNPFDFSRSRSRLLSTLRSIN